MTIKPAKRTDILTRPKPLTAIKASTKAMRSKMAMRMKTMLGAMELEEDKMPTRIQIDAGES